MINMIYDVIIVGGGVIGCAIARELSKYKLRTVLVEKNNDVCNETSAANSAIVHSGYTVIENSHEYPSRDAVKVVVPDFNALIEQLSGL